MAHFNIHHVQAKITSYLDLEDYLKTETAGGQSDPNNILQLETLNKITTYLLANDDKWLKSETTILYEIADNIIHKH